MWIINKVFHKFPELHRKVSLHLVEVSPALTEMQEKTLTGRLLNNHQSNEERQEDATDEKSHSSEVQEEDMIARNYNLSVVRIQTQYMLNQS